MLIDLHCDTIYEMYEKGKCVLSDNGLCVNTPYLKEASSLIQCFALFDDKNKYGYDFEHMESFASFYHAVIDSEDAFNKIYSADDIKYNKLNALLTVEDCGCIGLDIDKIDKLYSLGIRMAAPIWNHENCIGTPNSVSNCTQGLTPFGKEAIRKMEDIGMIIDVSHMSDESFCDVCAITERPFIASHSNARSLCANRRNLTDKMLRIIAERGGVIGLNFYPVFINGTHKCSAGDIAAHARYIKNMAGIDSIAVGSDFDGFEGECEITNISRINLLEAALKKIDFTDDEVEKILYGNALRVFKELLH